MADVMDRVEHDGPLCTVVDDLFPVSSVITEGEWQGCPDWLVRASIPPRLFPDWTNRIAPDSPKFNQFIEHLQSATLIEPARLDPWVVMHMHQWLAYRVSNAEPYLVNAHYAWYVRHLTPGAVWWLADGIPATRDYGDKVENPTILLRVHDDGRRVGCVAPILPIDLPEAPL